MLSPADLAREVASQLASSPFQSGPEVEAIIRAAIEKRDAEWQRIIFRYFNRNHIRAVESDDWKALMDIGELPPPPENQS